jgi:hypothetical protein
MINLLFVVSVSVVHVVVVKFVASNEVIIFCTTGRYVSYKSLAT